MESSGIKKTPCSVRSFMAGVVGIEPTLMVLETIVLPLNYTPIAVLS